MRLSPWWLASFAAVVLSCGNTPPPATPVNDPNAIKDSDGDGVPDDEDLCANEKEDGLPPFPHDGCKADPNDRDGDGISDANDKCPDQPETWNGYQDEDGCPDEIPAEAVKVQNEELRCDARILFEYGKATIEQASQPLIDRIANALIHNPDIEFVEVAGHADKAGNEQANIELTKKRAEAVIDALARRGVEKARMRAAGYGSYCPIDLDTSREARDRNRRVEFKIIRRSGALTGVSLGCPAAARAGLLPAAIRG